MQHRELRFKTADFRTSKTDNGKMIVSGYVNLTGEFSDPLTISRDERFIETIAPGAFQRALERAEKLGNDIDFLAEHDTTKILSSTRNKSLTLVEDDKGLFMSAIITPTTWGRDFYNLISDGIIRNFSFGFTVEEENDEWEFNSNGLHKRVIRDLDLFEVSIVRYPAYPQSYVEARNLTSSSEIIDIRRGEKQMDKEIEKREEDIKEEEEKEKPEVVDVTGSIIATDQRLNTIERKLDEVLNIFMSSEEEKDIEEEKEVKEEKKQEEEEKKEESTEDLETKSEPVEEKEERSKEDELKIALDAIIKEYEGEEE